MESGEITSIEKYVRATNYLSAAQIYLKDNFLLERKLEFKDIKPRLLGHWGTCPGINFVYANLNNLIKKKKCSMMFILGPGHGFPALQANLFIEETLGKFYPEAKVNSKGMEYVIKNFSWPYGFPSHTNPGTPGAILEGGELGYALSTAYGATLDNKNLIVACLIGDGEAETGPTATAWHLNKFVDPKNNGVVLPILHLNGYKISGPTIFGRMDNDELISLFEGYGYDPIIVEGSDAELYHKMVHALEKSYNEILKVKGGFSKHLPMIILKTLKGWTGIRKLRGEKIEGNCLSHQVIVKNAKTSDVELEFLEEWLKSYNFNELFRKNKFIKEIEKIIPRRNLRMGLNKHTYASKNYRNLKLPNISKFARNENKRGEIEESCMKMAGDYLNEVFKLNEENKNFRMVSPDETYSNKLDSIFNSTGRAFTMPIKSWDKNIGENGRVIEMLSEHSLQGLAQGYILTGRHCVFASYEAFIEIISSMADQYAKFLKASKEIKWRKGVSSMNYILTSSGWRQEHNGFSHQNPSFIGNLLEKYGCDIRVYFPADGNSTLAVLEECLKSKDRINVIVAGKTVEPIWLSEKEAKKELKDGIMIWEFASDKNPDIVFASAGDYLTKEMMAAVDYLRKELPGTRIRTVNVIELTSIGIGNKDNKIDFEKYFTKDKPVIFNYHGYPDDVKEILIDEKECGRFKIHGYRENGSTTTPFDMHVRNGTSRFHLILEAVQMLRQRKAIDEKKAERIIKEFESKLTEHKEYIIKNGVDPNYIRLWQWQKDI
ncbi:MAG: phosphoketolase family protein [Nanoarchaeota archaeon]